MIMYHKPLLIAVRCQCGYQSSTVYLLGVGGAKLVDELNFNPELYHLNEAHAISAAFYLYRKFGRVEE